MRKLLAWLGAGLLGCGCCVAQSALTITVDAQGKDFSLPDDFAGLSFESGSELPNRNGVHGYLFSPTNQELVTLFQNTGIHNLRLGGGSVDIAKTPIPGFTEISNVFGFAKAAGHLNVLYSLRLLNGDMSDDCSKPGDACLAGFIWQNFSSMLAGFSVGNEPDFPSYHRPDPKIRDYPSYLVDWRSFVQNISRATPGVKFFGPDTGSWSDSTYYRGKSWTQRFAEDEQGSPIIAAITQHYYAGGHPGRTTAAEAIENMLSIDWVTNDYPRVFSNNLAPVLAAGFTYRLTEANDYLAGITNASDSFASALWALDFMHWWAANGCAGVNFHNKSWLCTDTIYLDSTGHYAVNPKAYGIKAFDLGAHGEVKPTSLVNPDGLNVTAYAVGSPNALFVTVINKEHGAAGRSASVSIVASGAVFSNAAAMFLTAPHGNVRAQSGITLGGAAITAHSPWQENWSRLRAESARKVSVLVPAAAAVVVRFAN